MHAPLSDRAEVLLKTLIQRYIHDGQPVGSRTLARESGLDLSPATIRNVMSDLEELGLIHAPHTSAGRVPTQTGYRVFVDTMLTVQPLNHKALDEIEGRLNEESDPQQLLESATDLLSQVTHFAGVVMMPRHDLANFRQIEFLKLSGERVLAILITEDGRVQNRVLSVQRQFAENELVEAANFFNERYNKMALNDVRGSLIREMQKDRSDMDRIMRNAIEISQGVFDESSDEIEQVVVKGGENLLDSPDLAELEKLRRIFDTFKTKHDLLELLDKSLKASGVNIFIGDESGYNALNDCSVVTAPYEVNDKLIGVLGVIGPTRMSYADVIPVVDMTARLLGSALSANERSDRIGT